MTKVNSTKFKKRYQKTKVYIGDIDEKHFLTGNGAEYPDKGSTSEDWGLLWVEC